MASKDDIPPWGLAIAGATGAVLANTLVYPLDIVKTRLQVQMKRKPGDVSHHPAGPDHYEGTLHAIQTILAREGLEGLYSGIVGCLVGVASTNFAYFYWDTNPGTAIELSLGAAAGALAQLFTIPIAVVTTRQQTQPKGERKGLWATAKEVVDGEDGVAGLWRGLNASMVLCVNPAITYGAYQRLKDVMYPNKVALKSHEAFLLGAMSKALATIATQPLIVAKVGLQSRPPPARNGKPFKSFVEVMKFIVEHEGLLGLFKGIGPQILKGVLVQGFLMMTKERIELAFILLFRYIRAMRQEQIQKLAAIAAEKVAIAAENTKVVAEQTAEKLSA
ncbi:hypothetical protein AMS68_006502 [Peltaster fructicola]|uniref:Mitochondrial thiamine pyrophosphate carrier 1 n=1 Tax=Peltaster fructicola TaxID=286661 RepID=A0A6H0Y244_9PEZI|nr:hypothetical protein AMS68_006502 [Peltaster fructicola]